MLYGDKSKRLLSICNNEMGHHLIVDDFLPFLIMDDICSPLSRIEEVNRAEACEKREAVSAAPLCPVDRGFPIAMPEDYKNRWAST